MNRIRKKQGASKQDADRDPEKVLKENIKRALKKYSSLPVVERALKAVENGDKLSNGWIAFDDPASFKENSHLLSLMFALGRLQLAVELNKICTGISPIDEEQLNEVIITFEKLLENQERTDIDRKAFAEKVREYLYKSGLTNSS